MKFSLVKVLALCKYIQPYTVKNLTGQPQHFQIIIKVAGLDEKLLRNGFLKQARQDFLALREYCMTDAQRKELKKKLK